MYIDSHCHLNFPELQARLPEILADMQTARVDRAIVICTTLEEWEPVRDLARAHANLWSTVGVHPDNEGVREPTVEDLVERGREARVVAIGETGLDYYRLGERSIADMEWQRERLRVHVRAARLLGKPLVIHTRSASADTLAILREEGAEAVGGVFHCFTETAEVAAAALDMGFHLSFSGILTFRNAVDLKAVAAQVPLERCLIETDSPYLAPAPHRGKTNTPALVPLVAAELARLKGLDVHEVARVTTANCERLFGLSA
ncbi:TatD DNase family protein [Sphaerotilus hippei]|uniref:TatD DNase family protein n=1 Tax=Sphaerotilus hippei TaxID=744406 RepID=A0A318H390_9BURK|nr:TatD family hydrolase [Sphaerotilus hippei]PXW98025.1 TatD DNase family protein [Sphaerotilus hippei]